MKIKKFLLYALMIVGVVACKYDDDALWDKVNSLDERVSVIENQLTQMNSDISSVGVIVNALQNKVYVSEVKTISGGYQIIFTNGKTITIKDGKDGIDGKTPFIGENGNWWIGNQDTGVAAHGKDGVDGLTPRIGEDGNWWVGDQNTGIAAKGQDGKDAPIIGIDVYEGKYYWVQIYNNVKTWLTDAEGNKLPVTGTDGITPILRVNTAGYWIISYDRGITFTELLDENNNPIKAEGKDGQQGDSFFRSVKVENGELVLVLADGTVLRIPIVYTSTEENIQGIIQGFEGETLTIGTIMDEKNVVGEFSIQVKKSDLPQMITATTVSGNIVMMIRNIFDPSQVYEMNAESTALALVTSNPFFAGIDRTHYNDLISLIKTSSQYATFLAEVQRSIDNRNDIFDLNNTALQIAFSNLVEDILKPAPGVASRSFISNWEQLNINDPYPFLIQVNGNVLSITNTSLSPAYNGKVTHPVLGTKDWKIPTRENYNGWELIYQSIYGMTEGSYGTMANQEPVTFSFTAEGEYRFKFKRNDFDFYTNLILGLLQDIGIPLKTPKAYEKNFIEKLTRQLEIDGMFAVRPGQELSDYYYSVGTYIVEILSSKIFEDSKDGKEFYKAYPRLGNTLKCANKLFKWGAIIKGSSNALLRIGKRLQAPDEINFCLCYYENDVQSCSNVELIKRESSDSQLGYAGQRLLEPLSVLVRAKAEDGSLIQTEYQKVKFEVVSGGGSLSEQYVGTEGDYFADTYWTLGDSGEQKVKAVAVDMITGQPISEPVYFTAVLQDTPEITVRLDWHKLSGRTDIDLHMIDPAGEEIAYYNRTSSLGGWLDRDDVVGPGPEHIYWRSAPDGNYVVQVHYYGSYSHAVTTFKVTINVGGQVFGPFVGSIAYDQTITIGTIVMPDASMSRSTSAVPRFIENRKVEENIVYPKKTEMP